MTLLFAFTDDIVLLQLVLGLLLPKLVNQANYLWQTNVVSKAYTLCISLSSSSTSTNNMLAV